MNINSKTFTLADFFPKMAFSCRANHSFTLLSRVCDNVYNCPDGTDELFCQEQICPNSCICENFQLLECKGQINFSSTNFEYFKHVKIDNLLIIQKDESIKKGFNTVALSIKNTKTVVLKKLVENFMNIIHLNLSYNFLNEFQSKILKNIVLIQNLDLSFNHLKNLHRKSFSDLLNLINLNISFNNLNFIPNYAFFDLISLKKLTIRENGLVHLSEMAFVKLKKLHKIILEFPMKDHVKSHHFKYLISLKEAHFLEFQFCCLLKNSLKNLQCTYKENNIKVCMNYGFELYDQITFFSLSILIIISIIAELILMRIFHLWKNHRKIYSILHDFFVAFYMLIIFSYSIFQNFDDKEYDSYSNMKMFCQLSRLIFVLLIAFTFTFNLFTIFQFLMTSFNPKLSYVLSFTFSFILILTDFLFDLNSSSCSIIIFHPRQFFNEKSKIFTYFFIIYIFAIPISTSLCCFIIFKKRYFLWKKNFSILIKMILKNFVYLAMLSLSKLKLLIKKDHNIKILNIIFLFTLF